MNCHGEVEFPIFFLFRFTVLLVLRVWIFCVNKILRISVDLQLLLLQLELLLLLSPGSGSRLILLLQPPCSAQFLEFVGAEPSMGCNNQPGLSLPGL